MVRSLKLAPTTRSHGTCSPQSTWQHLGEMAKEVQKKSSHKDAKPKV